MTWRRTTVHEVERIGTTPNANPRYRLLTDFGSLVTAPDSSCNYEIPNLQTPTAVKINLDRHHRITHVKEIKP